MDKEGDLQCLHEAINLLVKRYGSTEDRKDVDELVERARRVGRDLKNSNLTKKDKDLGELLAERDFKINLSASLINLAECFANQYRNTNAETCLDKAIEITREAVSLNPNGRHSWTYSMKLIGLLGERYKCTKDTKDEDEAIETARQAIASSQTSVEGPASSKDLMAISKDFEKQYQKTKSGKYLNEAIEMAKQAAVVEPSLEESWVYCMTMRNLYMQRYKQTKDPDDIDEAKRVGSITEVLRARYNAQNPGSSAYERKTYLKIWEEWEKVHKGRSSDLLPEGLELDDGESLAVHIDTQNSQTHYQYEGRVLDLPKNAIDSGESVQTFIDEPVRTDPSQRLQDLKDIIGRITVDIKVKNKS